MATQRIQLKITVDRELNAVLQRLADAMGTKRATLVSDYLKEASPSFEHLASILEAAHMAPEIAQQRLVRALEQAADEGKNQLGDMLNQIDAFDPDLSFSPGKRGKRTTAK